MKNKFTYNYNGLIIDHIRPVNFNSFIDFIKFNYSLDFITNLKYLNEEGNKVFISNPSDFRNAIRMYEDSNLKSLLIFIDDDFKNTKMDDGFMDINQNEESVELTKKVSCSTNLSNSTSSTINTYTNINCYPDETEKEYWESMPGIDDLSVRVPTEDKEVPFEPSEPVKPEELAEPLEPAEIVDINTVSECHYCIIDNKSSKYMKEYYNDMLLEFKANYVLGNISDNKILSALLKSNGNCENALMLLFDI